VKTLKNKNKKQTKKFSKQGSAGYICGSYDDVKMHHVKPNRKVESKDARRKHLIAISGNKSHCVKSILWLYIKEVEKHANETK